LALHHTFYKLPYPPEDILPAVARAKRLDFLYSPLLDDTLERSDIPSDILQDSHVRLDRRSGSFHATVERSVSSEEEGGRRKERLELRLDDFFRELDLLGFRSDDGSVVHRRLLGVRGKRESSLGGGGGGSGGRIHLWRDVVGGGKEREGNGRARKSQGEAHRPFLPFQRSLLLFLRGVQKLTSS